MQELSRIMQTNQQLAPSNMNTMMMDLNIFLDEVSTGQNSEKEEFTYPFKNDNEPEVADIHAFQQARNKKEPLTDGMPLKGSPTRLILMLTTILQHLKVLPKASSDRLQHMRKGTIQ
ncbi:hypothetical protein SUGI_0263210 [Cryptomeria japonica]|nr:hypothetical protein SUGI_0263210 [Cryptomeria japonica]